MKKDKEWLKNEMLNLRNASNRVMVVAIGEVMELIDQLDEPVKVVIPQFVADELEHNRYKVWYSSALIEELCLTSDELVRWLEVPSNEKLLLKAWLDDYEVEKEKMYRVGLPSGHVMYKSGDRKGEPSYSYIPEYYFRETKEYLFTESEIKAIDPRYWPFAVEVAE